MGTKGGRRRGWEREGREIRVGDRNQLCIDTLDMHMNFHD